MKRTFLGLLVLGVACGGRTTLDDSTDDSGIIGVDGSPVGPDGSPIGVDGSPVGPDGGPIIDDGGPIFVDAISPFDAGPPPGVIQCGTSTCNSSTQVCCVTFNGQTLNETCTAQGQCQGGGLSCSSASSCPNGEVCCATITQTKQTAQCEKACQGGFQNPQLCASSAECPNGTTCKPTPLGFSVCRP